MPDSDGGSPDTLRRDGLNPPKAESARDRAGVPKTEVVGLPKMLLSLKKADGGSRELLNVGRGRGLGDATPSWAPNPGGGAKPGGGLRVGAVPEGFFSDGAETKVSGGSCAPSSRLSATPCGVAFAERLFFPFFPGAIFAFFSF